MELGLSSVPELVVVIEEADARRLGYRGSPTVTVDGRDVAEPPPGEPGLHFG